ncbi:hypothetical protein [Frankia nepalensis]|uniref:Uncharacterized protein n=1 Tax=Frankia nepalensis TaxID=1836974 RepID=A0A937RHC7_9ACTN|nr:hypothetical protein [Frankia nepalensis]MBL7502589.1 hypothetical protein [Frankia nepalensis]MBL7514744.1 hypothetical protein [Frankia nepalensis]MBL7628975.1 hypothetical protein [Frankia nepalensis]
MSGFDEQAVSELTAGDEAFERRLRAALAATVADVELAPLAGAAVLADRRAQRRRWVASGIAAAAAVAMVVGGVTATTRDVGGSDRPAPATAGGPRETLFGVSVGWLPDGLARYGQTVITAKQQAKPWYLQTVNFAIDGDVDRARATGSYYSMMVLRPSTASPVPDVDAWRERETQSDRNLEGLSETFERVTVNGRDALLIRAEIGSEVRSAGMPAGSGQIQTPRVAYSLYWRVDLAGGGSVGVGVGGPDRAAVQRIAESVDADGPLPGPADRATAAAQIRAAAQTAFDGTRELDMLTALEDPQRLRPPLESALATDRDSVRKTKFLGFEDWADRDTEVMFLSATEAVVGVRVAAVAPPGTVSSVPTGDESTAIETDLRFVVVDGEWKLTVMSWCSITQFAVPGCPMQ